MSETADRTGVVTINSTERGVLFQLLAERLAEADLVHLLLAAGRPLEAEATAVTLQQDLRVMAAIGWDVDDPRDEFRIGVALDEFLATVTRLADGAERSLAHVEATYGLDNADAASADRSATICRRLIRSLRATDAG